MNPDELTWLALPMEPTGAWARLEDDLRHGYHPKKEDLLVIWHQAYSHRPIPDAGIRCFQCQGATVTEVVAIHREQRPCGSTKCPSCDGSGWARKPGGGK